MMSGGIGLRASGLAPEAVHRRLSIPAWALRLLLAGLRFGRNYGKAAVCRSDCPKPYLGAKRRIHYAGYCMETLFDAVYLTSVITLGVLMIRGMQGQSTSSGCSASWRWCWAPETRSIWFPGPWPSAPRAWKTTPLPFGTSESWITSVTITIFYVLLYYVWRQRYHVQGQEPCFTASVYGLDRLCALSCA